MARGMYAKLKAENPDMYLPVDPYYMVSSKPIPAASHDDKPTYQASSKPIPAASADKPTYQASAKPIPAASHDDKPAKRGSWFKLIVGLLLVMVFACGVAAIGLGVLLMPVVTFRDGTLLKGSDSTVYVIEDNKKRGICSAEVFESMGYNWSNIITLSDDTLNTISEGSILCSSD